ncbi:MAG: M28 family peptidase [Phycisphaerae bacterium]
MSPDRHYVSPQDSERRLADRLRSHVEILAGLIGPRHLAKPTTMEAAASYIERQLAEFGETVKREVYTVASAEATNIYIERKGTKHPDQVVVVGAHYDTVPETPGADDNASAVAMLIEVARLLRPLANERTIRLIGFACEEPPHFYTDSMGSQQHARQCRMRDEQLVGMVCLEMVGYYSTAKGSQNAPSGIPRWLRWAFPRRGDFLAAVGNLRSIPLLWQFRRGFKRVSSFPLYSIALPELLSVIRLSDNSSFWDQGYPALMITDTSFLRNPHYHLPTDTPDTLDYELLAKATVGVAGAVARIAKAPGRVMVASE